MIQNRKIKPLYVVPMLVCGIFGICQGGLMAEGQPADTPPTEDSPVLSPLEIRDWFALGSGCKGKDGGIGDIRMAVRQNPANSMIWHIDFSMGSYQLDGEKPVAEKPTFARECSLRLAAYPGKNLKISNLSLDAEISVNKQSGTGLTLLSRMMTVQGNLNEWSYIHKKTESLQNRIHKIYLSPDAKGRDFLKDIPCEKPKVLGADFQILNEREDFKSRVLVKPAGKNTVSMTITLEKCTPVEAPPENTQDSV